LSHNKLYIGKTVAVLVDSTKNKVFGIGKTRGYKTVKFVIGGNTPESLVGAFVKVKILEAQSFGLIGELIEDEQ
jgi:tRNA A37 methylthiotransferase MiaB